MRAVAALALIPLLAVSPAGAEDFGPDQRQQIITILRDALKSDPSILRDGLQAVQADEARRQAAATRDAIAMLSGKLLDGTDPVAGNPFGDVTLIEFYDTRCPYCRHQAPVLADLLRQDPMVRVVFKDMPVLGPPSQLESRALLAAQRQGGYFKLQSAVMANGAPPTRDTLRADADRLGLDGGRLMQDIDDPAIKARLETNVALGQQLGIQGTPALIVGDQIIAGAAELDELRQAVADARAKR